MNKLGRMALAVPTTMFREVDWQVWSGAERFSCGHQPWITEVEHNIEKFSHYPNMTIIGDNDGIEVIFTGDIDASPGMAFTYLPSDRGTNTPRTTYHLCRAVLKMALYGTFSDLFVQNPPFESATPQKQVEKLEFFFEGSVTIEAAGIEQARQVFQNIADGFEQYLKEHSHVVGQKPIEWLDVSESKPDAQEMLHISELVSKVVEDGLDG